MTRCTASLGSRRQILFRDRIGSRVVGLKARTEFSQYPPILDSFQAAELLGMKKAAVQQLCRDDLMPYRRLPGKARVYKFSRDELIAWFCDELPGVTVAEALHT